MECDETIKVLVDTRTGYEGDRSIAPHYPWPQLQIHEETESHPRDDRDDKEHRDLITTTNRSR